MPFQLSSGIYGMIIFFGLLHFEIIKPLEAGYTCALIMKFMAIPFIPISVGFLEYLEIIEHHFFSLIVACILSTLFVLVVTAITAEKLVSKL
jgi:holin-like protein